MGQRTAIILQHVNNCKWAARNGKVNTRVFYHQWGIGRILPSQLVSILNGILSASSYDENLAQKLMPQGCLDITSEYEMDALNSLDFKKPQLVGDMIKNANNNNGGIFVRITTDEHGEIGGIEYAYMLGNEEGGKYKKFCTSKQWFEKVGGKYVDEDFLTYYNAIINYFGAKECNKENMK